MQATKAHSWDEAHGWKTTNRGYQRKGFGTDGGSGIYISARASLTGRHEGRNNPLAQRILGVTVQTHRHRKLRRAVRTEGSRLEGIEGLSTAAALPKASHRWRGFARRAGKPVVAGQLGQTRQRLRLPQPLPAIHQDEYGQNAEPGGSPPHSEGAIPRSMSAHARVLRLGHPAR